MLWFAESYVAQLYFFPAKREENVQLLKIERHVNVEFRPA